MTYAQFVLIEDIDMLQQTCILQRERSNEHKKIIYTAKGWMVLYFSQTYENTDPITEKAPIPCLKFFHLIRNNFTFTSYFVSAMCEFQAPVCRFSWGRLSVSAACRQQQHPQWINDFHPCGLLLRQPSPEMLSSKSTAVIWISKMDQTTLTHNPLCKIPP